MEYNIGFKGLFKIEAVKIVDGKEVSRRVLADWFPNLITDLGLNRIATYLDYLAHCQVGSSNNAPANGDTALGNRIAGTSTAVSTATGTQSSTPYYSWIRKTYRFAEGVATGNLSEIGVGYATSGSLFSRALILDIGGNPTTITVLADETLDVVYEFRWYPKLTDDTGTVTLTGNIGGTYDWTIRLAYATMGSGYGVISAITFEPTIPCSGALAAITTYPSGGSNAGTSVAESYVSGSYEKYYNVTFGLTVGNFAGGIAACYGYAGAKYIQVGFSPAIPKTSNDVVTLRFKTTWGRY